eukprot:CAMPEP_0177237486 /NCGR_PEP_ID=MMETSP0367-20130122/46020_1 /TAXON_ID=447022 ORGANISM="Scrippsiella hangoei-like, Strain SHHI-4" /NCGR_SAMPLE_ID=MMETSP0367 /ASSEMBLY_ACC=CAM_ASM_000362 /LENGTH=540 /DNA_ID=CAMNT_0018688479 /DNA_START=23 /DNA_END=1645 /DNA_ORIENTATION=+
MATTEQASVAVVVDPSESPKSLTDNEEVVCITEENDNQEVSQPDDGSSDQDVKPTSPGFRLMSLLCLVGGLEGADSVLLPCTLIALQQDLGLTLNDLALMGMIQGLAGNVAAPMWGVFADRGIMKRKTIVVVGSVIQGLITVILAGVDSLWIMFVLRALNGFFLASLRPIANGIVADTTVETNRGKVYGAMNIAMNVGTMGGTLIGTNLARQTVMGLQGWRIAFIIVGGLSVVVGFVALAFMVEPPKVIVEKKEGGGNAFRTEIRELCKYFRMPSFCVLILQGCFGCVPWNALGYKTLFFQLGGIKDWQASIIDVASQIAGSMGGMIGGIVGDSLSRCSRFHGRPITAQISVLAGIPVAWFIFMTSPPESSAFTYYLLLMIVLGLTATWCGVGVNLPILSEIVKSDRRATIMAWEGTLESSCSQIFGNSMVGLLAQSVFGYDLASVKIDGHRDAANTKALGMALMLVSFFPWMLCFVCYTLLHWSYPRDLKWLAEQDAKAAETKAAEAKKIGAEAKAPKTQKATEDSLAEYEEAEITINM